MGRKYQWQIFCFWQASNSISCLIYHLISIFPKCNIETFHNKRFLIFHFFWLAFSDFSRSPWVVSSHVAKINEKNWEACHCWADISEFVLKPRECIWLSGKGWGRSLILKQIPKLLEQMVPVSWRKIEWKPCASGPCGFKLNHRQQEELPGSRLDFSHAPGEKENCQCHL